MDPARPAPPNVALAQLVDVLGTEDTRNLVRTYLQEFDGLIRTMAAGDRTAQHRAAHALKSSSRHMGLQALAGRLQNLEQRLQQPAGSISARDLEAVTEEFNRAAGSLRTFAGG